MQPSASLRAFRRGSQNNPKSTNFTPVIDLRKLKAPVTPKLHNSNAHRQSLSREEKPNRTGTLLYAILCPGLRVYFTEYTVSFHQPCRNVRKKSSRSHVSRGKQNYQTQQLRLPRLTPHLPTAFFTLSQKNIITTYPHQNPPHNPQIKVAKRLENVRIQFNY